MSMTDDEIRELRARLSKCRVDTQRITLHPAELRDLLALIASQQERIVELECLIRQLVELSWESESARRGFRDGFNGKAKAHHFHARSAFDRGRRSAIMLGYKEP